MKTLIETTQKRGDLQETLTVEVGNTEFGDNVVIRKKTATGPDWMRMELMGDDVQALRLGKPAPSIDLTSAEISFLLDAETARALSFTLAELAKDLRGKEC